MTKVTSRPAAATFPALGTTVTVATTDPARLVQAVEIVDNAVRSLDQAASRFRDDSELMRLQNSGGRAVGVSDELFVALDEALRAASATGGLLDPTVGEALEVCGYDRDFASVASDGAALTVRLGRVPGYRAIRLDRLRRSVAVPRVSVSTSAPRPRPGAPIVPLPRPAVRRAPGCSSTWVATSRLPGRPRAAAGRSAWPTATTPVPRIRG